MGALIVDFCNLVVDLLGLNGFGFRDSYAMLRSWCFQTMVMLNFYSWRMRLGAIMKTVVLMVVVVCSE